MKKVCKMGKGLLLLVCSLCMAVLLPPKSAHAETNYNIWVGGVRVTDSNASNITGYNIKSGTVSYDASANILTLNNAEIVAGTDYGIYANKSVKIKLVGSNTVTGADATEFSAGIRVSSDGNLEILGDGTLSVTSGTLTADSDFFSWGIRVDSGSLTISGGCTIEATAHESKKGCTDSQVIAISSPTVTLDNEIITAARTGVGNAAVASDCTVDNLQNFTYVKIVPGTPVATETYSINVSPDEVNFTEIKGETVTPKTITVTNTGTGATGELTLALSGPYANKFEISQTTLASIEAGQSKTFTVTPKADMTTGIYYDAYVMVTGSHDISSSVPLELYVKPETPILSGLSGGTVRYVKGATADPLTITVDCVVDLSGTLEYQWAKGSLEHPTYVVGEVGRTFIPPTDTVGTENYFCYVTHWDGTGNRVTSVVTTVEVYMDTTPDPGTTGGSGSTDPSGGSSTSTENAGTSAVSY